MADPHTPQPVPADAQTMGEILFRGNITMKGYLKNPNATEEAFRGGWYHTGDLAVVYLDGYVKIKDRSMTSSSRVARTSRPWRSRMSYIVIPMCWRRRAVARPDEKWGETPCAFVMLKSGAGPVSADELIAYCRERLAHYKCPKTVVFGPLPKTSTGKIQKNVLREQAKEL